MIEQIEYDRDLCERVFKKYIKIYYVFLHTQYTTQTKKRMKTPL
jgi:hypothetical protein